MSAPNTIIRLRHERSFTQIANDTARDWNISLKARGLIVVAMSLPDDWSLTVEWLASQGPDGRDSVRAGMQELMDVGYAKYVRKQRGGFWVIRESLTVDWGKFSTTENPKSKSRTTDFSQSENPQSYKDQVKQIPNTAEDDTIPFELPASSIISKMVDFDRFWTAYPRKVAKPAALKAFKKHTAHVEEIIASIAAHKKTDQWQKDGGNFIPHPATFLNQERWRDTPNGKNTSHSGATSKSSGNAGTTNDQYAGQY